MFGRASPGALDLTDDQKAQIKAILRTHATEIEAQMTAGTAARRALHDAIMAAPIDEAAIRARAAELSARSRATARCSSRRSARRSSRS